MNPIERLRAQLERVAAELGAEGTAAQLERPRNPEHGDLATNLAMTLAGRLRRPPRLIADQILERLSLAEAGVAAAEVAGAGFINFRLAGGVVQGQLLHIVKADRDFGRAAAPTGQRWQVEFVSANPTGPLHVAHGRGAALGDAIASLLQWSGHEVEREFYVNDAGVQIGKLGESLDARWRELQGQSASIPDGGYHGSYVTELARQVDAEQHERLASLDADARVAFLKDWGVAALEREQDETLRAFGVRMDSYYPESRVYQEKLVETTLQELAARGLTYEGEGALWLRTTDFGDDKDRVLVKSDGTYTYFAPDIAYHRDKIGRGFDHGIDIWGADHHGYVPRMKAALAALGHPEFLTVEIVQMVRIVRGGEEVKMSKRAGDFVTLRELFEETGADVARYFFLMRRGDAQMLFDLDLALDHSEKNPVYKVQYAHARLASIFRKAGLDPAALEAQNADLTRLTLRVEQDLIKQLDRFPDVVTRAAEGRSPHLVCEYLEETSGMVNSWYHGGNPSRNPELAVLVGDPALRAARLVLARGIQVVLRNGLELLGLTAPDRMEREETA